MANRRKVFSVTENVYLLQVVQEHPDAVIHDRSSVAAHQKEVAWSAMECLVFLCVLYLTLKSDGKT